jgi:hypothetical protein
MRLRQEAMAAQGKGKDALEVEAVRVMREVQLAAGCTSPPIDLTRLAGHLGVTDVRYVPLSMRGRTLAGRGSWVIEVNDSLSLPDRRFTEAHELGHLVLGTRLGAKVGLGARHREDADYDRIERVCDQMAEELLLPADWLERRLFRTEPTLQVALAVSKEAECSVDMVLMRALTLHQWAGNLWWLRRDGDQLVVFETYPPKDERFLAEIRPFGAADVPFRALTYGPVAYGAIQVDMFGHLTTYVVECVALGPDMVLCLIPRRR